MELIVATADEVEALHSKFQKFNIQLLQNPQKLYGFVGILDVFNRVLSEEEANELLGTRHNVNHGTKFISTFTDLMDSSGQGVYIHIHKKAVYKDQFKSIRRCFSRNEAAFFRGLFSDNKEIYKVKDHEAIVFLTKLSVYELVFVNFFFPSLDTAIIGNFDLSFPVYSKTSKGFNKCKAIAERNRLFIRQ